MGIGSSGAGRHLPPEAFSLPQYKSHAGHSGRRAGAPPRAGSQSRMQPPPRPPPGVCLRALKSLPRLALQRCSRCFGAVGTPPRWRLRHSLSAIRSHSLPAMGCCRQARPGGTASGGNAQHPCHACGSRVNSAGRVGGEDRSAPGEGLLADACCRAPPAHGRRAWAKRQSWTGRTLAGPYPRASDPSSQVPSLSPAGSAPQLRSSAGMQRGRQWDHIRSSSTPERLYHRSVHRTAEHRTPLERGAASGGTPDPINHARHKSGRTIPEQAASPTTPQPAEQARSRGRPAEVAADAADPLCARYSAT